MTKIKKTTKVAVVNPFLDALQPAETSKGSTPKQRIAHQLAEAVLSPSKLYREMVPEVAKVLRLLATNGEKLTEEDKDYMIESAYFAELRRIAASGKAANVHLLRGLTDKKNGFKLFLSFAPRDITRLTPAQAASVFGKIALCPVSAHLVCGFVAANNKVSFGKVSVKDWSEFGQCTANGQQLPAVLDVTYETKPEIAPAK